MSMLANLRVQVTADSLRVSTSNRALDLLAALALADVVAEAGFLLARAILTISY